MQKQHSYWLHSTAHAPQLLYYTWKLQYVTCIFKNTENSGQIANFRAANLIDQIHNTYIYIADDYALRKKQKQTLELSVDHLVRTLTQTYWVIGSEQT